MSGKCNKRAAVPMTLLKEPIAELGDAFNANPA